MPERQFLPRSRRHDLQVTLSVHDMPEIIAIVRGELAAILRDEAAGCDSITAARLREIADAFEAGQRPSTSEPTSPADGDHL